MYHQLKKMDIAEQAEFLTRYLVGIQSINGTKGEVEVAESILQVLQSFPYFRKNPELVWEQFIPNDTVGRKNIFALVQGKKASNNTVIFHSHIDTVGIEDFSHLKFAALNPDILEAFFSTYELDKDVQADARSRDWMFGRGSVDMKSGAAVHLANILYFTEHVDELPGNILLMFNPDEESQHKGVISAISELKRLKDEYRLEYVSAINNDFITPLYEGDPHRYIYTGAAGKILPSFYIYGRESHVGDTLSSLDPNFVAAEITRRIHNNLELAENIKGELTLPPTCLQQRDNKEFYTVQTATSSYLYFNFFLYEASAKEVMNKLIEITKEACFDAEYHLYKQYQEFLNRTGLPGKELSWHIEVTCLADFINELEEKGIQAVQTAKEVHDTHQDMEPRKLCFKIVEALQDLDPEKKPRVIIFFAPPYLPHNYLNEGNQRDENLLKCIEAVLADMEQKTGEQFALKKFFPYLADGSFLSLHESDEELRSLIDNFPEWESIYPVPVRSIREMNIPSINMGVYGKDGHKWTERVYKPYTFHVLPELIRNTAIKLLEQEEITVLNA
ncbi:arginine utilization protein RocB [Bacillus pakistanensis]|uniref:Arginine utilization protein RocB n=1 Tax=Rossellomorea pakistanensis TaxID=992288 RepID=A0ABS2NCA9_9BACI|nr:M20/M25/M40 family metallo-hydrolase [Bacillus pakistanensis]MBM7585450.1 arginine utilization protein RocB [Bacillus pakistanensis]